MFKLFQELKALNMKKRSLDLKWALKYQLVSRIERKCISITGQTRFERLAAELSN